MVYYHHLLFLSFNLFVINLTRIPGPDGVKRFLLGRQLIVVPLGFLVAQITHFNRYPTYNFSPALYFFTISLGLPGKMMLLKVRGYWLYKVVNHDDSYQSNCCALFMEF